MATIVDYPDGVATAGPLITRLMDQPVEFEATQYLYEDGGIDVNVQPCGVQRWLVEYEGISVTDVTTLITHFNLAKGRVNDFEFYHRRNVATYAGVKYVELRINRRPRSWVANVSVTLEKLA